MSVISFSPVSSLGVLTNPEDFSVNIVNEKEIDISGLSSPITIDQLAFIREYRRPPHMIEEPTPPYSIVHDYYLGVHSMDLQVLIGGTVRIRIEEADFDRFDSIVVAGIKTSSGGGGGSSGGGGVISTRLSIPGFPTSGYLYVTAPQAPASFVAFHYNAHGSLSLGPIESAIYYSGGSAVWTELDPTVVSDNDYWSSAPAYAMAGVAYRIAYSYNPIQIWGGYAEILIK